ncbi:hypothetical protein SOPP22_16600 [Shewanella sp. OPT22]|nr:hypothetical protein SOPP22_16600 [Shewanella sp. OPT22]
MNFSDEVISNLDDLKNFLLLIETGALGLNGVEGVGMATNNADGRRFIAVFGLQHQLLYGRWVSEDVFQNGQDMVRNGVSNKH